MSNDEVKLEVLRGLLAKVDAGVAKNGNNTGKTVAEVCIHLQTSINSILESQNSDIVITIDDDTSGYKLV